MKKKNKMYNLILNDYQNKVIINGIIEKIFYDKDKNNNNYVKLIIKNKKVFSHLQYNTSIKCYLYNSLYNVVKNENYDYGDFIKIIGELQNRNNNLVIFVNEIYLLNKKGDSNYEKNVKQN